MSESNESIPVIREEIINALSKDIEKYLKLLNFFSLNEENFSKSVQIDLEEFCERIKYHEDKFSTFEKEKLIFIPHPKFSQSLNEKVVPQLKMIKATLENLKIKLSSLNNLLASNVNSEKVKFSSLNVQDYQSLSNSITNLKTLISGNIIISKIDSSEFQIKAQRFKESIKKLTDLKSKQNEIKLNMEKIKADLKLFNGLPKDETQLKELIKIKKAELEYI